MPKLMRLTEYGVSKNPVFINFDNVQYIEWDGNATAVFFSSSQKIFVTESPEAIAKALEGERHAPRP